MTPLSVFEVWICESADAGGVEGTRHAGEVHVRECVEGPAAPEKRGDEVAKATLVGFVDDIDKRTEWGHVFSGKSIAKDRWNVQG